MCVHVCADLTCMYVTMGEASVRGRREENNIFSKTLTTQVREALKEKE